MATKKKRRFRLPYWLGGGDRTCHGCGRRHSHHVEARCAACDRAYCSFCIDAVDGEPHCADCMAGGGP
ncbi:MAG TPA: hypothetical protein VNI54_18435 [Thermoanaerobaculia bacterium]|nr:hypothetical protein [Thermoanaerobaculia bacterium]